VKRVRLPQRLMQGSFDQLRACGAEYAECVLYWCAARTEPDLLTRLVHPVHQAGPRWYDVDSAWITKFFLDLRRAGQTVRVQVHTHPQHAGHSDTDDQFALAPAPGFLSLVIPNFAAGPATLADTVLMEMDTHGDWMSRPVQEVLDLV
jgi:hypothetical protein